ncbi:hypothetical protein LX64_02930 [Chitinophaga skermanii]|uniref:Uncharacterized protein n=1 Tax=Chitinophaga skermanii TaxID=331697 RepID=A0A327QL40_9BACT|nr:hypothetical protein [Chitinophaga skermanii]RAJ04053.1 hypothetical protein LX64_02930 [Chitinophaga skermanii]
MKKFCLFLCLCFYTACVFAQSNIPASQQINLAQKKSGSDVKVISGEYHIYFKKDDVLNAIALVDKTTKSKNSKLAQAIRENKVSTIDLAALQPAMRPYVDLFQSNIGTYLLLKGKAAVYLNNKKLITLIRAEASPEIVDLNGDARTPVFFAEKTSDLPLFLGDVDARVITKG